MSMFLWFTLLTFHILIIYKVRNSFFNIGTFNNSTLS